MNRVLVELTEQPIDLAGILSHIRDPHCGAEVLFTGTTRRWTQPHDQKTVNDGQKETSHLVYEAYHPMALSQMERLAQSALAQWPLHAVAIVHRTGIVFASETSVIVAVSAPHRSEAFSAAKWLIDSVKHEVPIWKQEHYVQDAAVWHHPTSGSCSCGHQESAKMSIEYP